MPLSLFASPHPYAPLLLYMYTVTQLIVLLLKLQLARKKNKTWKNASLPSITRQGSVLFERHPERCFSRCCNSSHHPLLSTSCRLVWSYTTFIKSRPPAGVLCICYMQLQPPFANTVDAPRVMPNALCACYLRRGRPHANSLVLLGNLEQANYYQCSGWFVRQAKVNLTSGK